MMRDTGESRPKDSYRAVEQQRTIRFRALKMLEEICEIVLQLSPNTEAKALSVLSELVAGDTILKICRTHQLTRSQAVALAEQAIEDIRQTLSGQTDINVIHHEKLEGEVEKLKSKNLTLEGELSMMNRRVKEAEVKYAQLEHETIELFTNPERRTAYMRQVPIYQLPVSAELKSYTAKLDFYTLGELLDIHPYYLITQYKFTRQLIDDLENFIKSAGLERKIINK